MVVVRIDDRGKESGWFVGMIIRGGGDGYLVRVSFPGEYRRPTYETPKRRWYTKATTVAKNDDHEGEFQSAWSGWVEIPRDPMLVLFSRIASSAFLSTLRERLQGSRVSSETAREYHVSVKQIFPLNPQKLYRAIFA